MPVIFSQSKKMGNFIAKMKIQTVPADDNRPDGYKVNFILLRLSDFQRMLLIDNHAPIGYHMHPDPDNPEKRVPIDVKTPYEALDLFVAKAKEITGEK